MAADSTGTASTSGDRPPRPGVGLVAAAWRNWWLVVLALGAACGGAVYYQHTTPPQYQASAQLLVVKKRPDAFTGVDTRMLSLDDYVATHQTLLRSTLLVERAIQHHQLDQLESLAHAPEDLTEVIAQGLAVTRTKTGGWGADNILVLSYLGTASADCTAILNALIATYQGFLDETYRDLSEETLRLITEARDELHKGLQQKEAAYREFRKNAPPLLWKGKDQVNLRLERLANVEARRSTLLLRKAELQGHLAALEEGIKAGDRREALLAQVLAWTGQPDTSRASRDTQSLAAQDRLQPLLMEEVKLLESHGEKHPEVESLRRRIAVTRELLASQASSAAGDKHLPPRLADPVEVYRQFCQQELRHIEISETALAKIAREEHDRARELTAYEVEEEGFRTDISRQQQLYDSILKQLQHVDLAKGVGGYDAKVITPPGPGKKVRPSTTWTFAGAGFLGLFSGLGLALLRELARARG